MLTFEGLAYLLEFCVIAIALYAFREQIASKMYGIRYKRFIVIDTGAQGYVILDKSLNSCTINGMKKTVNRANIQHNIIYYSSDCAENLKVEDMQGRYECYVNSEEFDTVYKNKLLQTLMLSLQNNMLIIITLLVFVSIALGVYYVYTMQDQMAKIDYIVWRVNQTYVGQ